MLKILNESFIKIINKIMFLTAVFPPGRERALNIAMRITSARRFGLRSEFLQTSWSLSSRWQCRAMLLFPLASCSRVRADSGIWGKTNTLVEVPQNTGSDQCFGSIYLFFESSIYLTLNTIRIQVVLNTDKNQKHWF